MRNRWIIGLALILALAACSNKADPEPRGLYDCSRNIRGTGDLEADIIGRWAFVQNASPQFFTFSEGGNAIRTWTSDEDDDVTYSAHPFGINGDVVTIADYGAYEFALDEDGFWTVIERGAEQEWMRCARADEVAQ